MRKKSAEISVLFVSVPTRLCFMQNLIVLIVKDLTQKFFGTCLFYRPLMTILSVTYEFDKISACRIFWDGPLKCVLEQKANLSLPFFKLKERNFRFRLLLFLCSFAFYLHYISGHVFNPRKKGHCLKILNS